MIDLNGGARRGRVESSLEIINSAPRSSDELIELTYGGNKSISSADL